MNPHEARRADHARGHVAMAVVPYMPWWHIPPAARVRHQPWLCVFHCDDGRPRPFVAFGGEAGMAAAVEHYLGPRIARRDPH